MEQRFLTILLGHNEWMTRVLLERCRQLTRDQFHQSFEIGPGKLHDTLRHVIGAMFRWADRIGGRTLRDSIEDRKQPFSAEELLDQLRSADLELREVADEITTRDGWGEEMEFVTPDQTYRFTRAAAMMHVITHGQYHRAQAVNMIRQLGEPPIGLDLDIVEWECIQTGQISP
jgi:uncharacterized damage-inducible protein DinB